jgi:hypothetical protein
MFNVRKVLLFTLIIGLLTAGCSLNGKKLSLVLQYQKATAVGCADCANCKAGDQELQKAFTTLKGQLGPKGIKVKLEEKKPIPGSAQAANSSRQVWVGEVPLETWLGAQTVANPGSCCSGNSGQSGACKSVRVGQQVFSVIPADLIVQAGNMASEQLLATGKIDPAAVKGPKGCAGCPGAGAGGCGMAR